MTEEAAPVEEQAVESPENMETTETVAVSLEDAQSMTGNKEEGSNADALNDPKKEEVEETALPSFFVEDDDVIRIEVDILFEKDTGVLVSVSRSGYLDEDQFKIFGYTKEWFELTPVGYEDMSTYRQRCSTYRQDAGKPLVDNVSLRNFLIVWHLKDWSMRDRNGKKIELKLTESGSLDDESIKVVYKMNTTMLDVVLTLFEKEMML
jgi:hypothetical protein